MVTTSLRNNESPLHNYEPISEEDYADLKFKDQETVPLDPLRSTGKSTTSIIANNVMSATNGLADLASILGLNPTGYFLLQQKDYRTDLDPNYNDAFEKLTSTIKKDPHAFVSAATTGLLDEWNQFTEDEFSYLHGAAKNFVHEFSQSTKRLFTESIYDCAKREGIDVNNPTEDQANFCRGQAILDALVVSDAYPGAAALKFSVENTIRLGKKVPTISYNTWENTKKLFDPPDDGDGTIAISSGFSKNNNTNPKNLEKNIHEIFVPVQGKTTKTSSGLILKDPDLSKIRRRFGWGSKHSYKKAKREIKNIYKDFIYPKALDAKGDIFNDIKLLQPEDQILVNMLLNETWVKTGWMPGKNNILFTEIDDSGIRFNYPRDNMGELKNLIPYNTMLHRMHLHALNPKQGDPVTQLQDLIQHEDLFKLFPELKTLNVKFTKGGNNVNFSGHYVPSSGVDSYGNVVQDPRGIIELNLKGLVATQRDLDIITKGNNLSDSITDATQESIMSTLFHEIQHVIQAKNNFLSSGRHHTVKEQFNEARAKNAENIVNRIHSFNTFNKAGFTSSFPLHKPLPDYYIQFYRNGDYDIVSDLARLSPTEYPTLAGSNAPSPIKLSPKAAELLAKKLKYDLYEKVGPGVDDFMSPRMFAAQSQSMKNPKKYFNNLMEGNVALNIKRHFMYYNDLMETEARLVQARMNLPFDRRKEIAPYQDYVDTYMQMRDERKAVPYSASKPSVAAARVTMFDLLMTSKKAEIKFTDITPKGGVGSSKLADLETNINDVEDFLSKLQKNIRASSLIKEMEKTTFKGDAFERPLYADRLSEEIAQSMVFQDFHLVFFSGIRASLALSSFHDPFIEGLKKMGLETIVPQIKELQAKYIDKALVSKAHLYALNPEQKIIAKKMQTDINRNSKSQSSYSEDEADILYRVLLGENYTFNQPLTMGDIDASKVTDSGLTIGTDKIPQIIEGPGQSISTIDNEYNF